MKLAMYLFAVVSLASFLGCASTQPPPPQGPSPEETAAMQELNRETQNPQPAPQAPQE
jgi:hypothetical protein